MTDEEKKLITRAVISYVCDLILSTAKEDTHDLFPGSRHGVIVSVGSIVSLIEHIEDTIALASKEQLYDLGNSIPQMIEDHSRELADRGELLRIVEILKNVVAGTFVERSIKNGGLH